MDDDLLAEVKAEAEAAARAEMERMDAARSARESAQAARRADAEAARQSEIDALVEAERARQRAVNEHRLAMFAPIPSAPPPVAAPAPPVAAPPPPAQVVGPHPRGAAFYVNVVGLPLLCLTAIVLTLVHNQRPVQPAPLPIVRIAPPVFQVEAAPFELKPRVERVLPVVHEPPPEAAPVKRPTRRRPTAEKPRTPFTIGPIDGNTE